MRTPGHDRELAAGFLLTEGIIRERRDVIANPALPRSGRAATTRSTFSSRRRVKVDFARAHAARVRHVELRAVRQGVHRVGASAFPAGDIAADGCGKNACAACRRSCARRNRRFAQTGGLHAAAVFAANGELIVLREDVGRHNAVDKVLGHGLLGGKLPFDSHICWSAGGRRLRSCRKRWRRGFRSCARCRRRRVWRWISRGKAGRAGGLSARRRDECLCRRRASGVIETANER